MHFNSFLVRIWIFVGFAAEGWAWEFFHRHNGTSSPAKNGSEIKGSTSKEIKTVNVKFVVSARDLPSMDPFINSAPDPFVTITYYGHGMEGSERVVETSRLENNHNPDWPEVFEINYVEGHKQKFKLVFKDYDDTSPTDYIGTAEISVGEMVKGSGGGKIIKKIISPKKDSKGTVEIYTLINNDINDNTTLRLTERKHWTITFQPHDRREIEEGFYGI